jgi:biotin carboxyl carrier protein
MPNDPRPKAPGPAEDTLAEDTLAEDTLADHAAIERLADDLVPALVAKLQATGLGEIEVREGSWRVRLRSPGTATAPAATTSTRRSADRGGRGQPGHVAHGQGPSVLGDHTLKGSTNGTQPGLAPVGPGRERHRGTGRDGGGRGGTVGTDRRVVATSPAVGVFQPSRDVTRGSRVRAGDRIGSVDVLGVAEEVVAPADAIVGATLVESGEAVEYGQPLVELDRIGPDTAVDVGGGAGEA